MLKVLVSAQLIVKRPKCHFFKNKVTFLGHILDGVGIRPRDVKVKAIMEFPDPSTKKEAMSFLGMVNFYRKFIDHCSAKAHPSTSLLVKKMSAGEKLSTRPSSNSRKHLLTHRC